VLQILDPIDGTTNFVHAMPLSAVSIGVAHRGKLVCGVIYDPFHDELFSAVVGGGALLNGAPIKVGPQATLGEAVVAAGAPPTGNRAEQNQRYFVLVVTQLLSSRSACTKTVRTAYSALLA
jgi:myo-inositol-1(or 4)-monophosphatase